MRIPGFGPVRRAWEWLVKEEAGARKGSARAAKKLDKNQRNERRRRNAWCILSDDCPKAIEATLAPTPGFFSLSSLGRRSKRNEELQAAADAALAIRRGNERRLRHACYMLQDDCTKIIEEPPVASDGFFWQKCRRPLYMYLGDAGTAGCDAAMLLLFAFGLAWMFARKRSRHNPIPVGSGVQSSAIVVYRHGTASTPPAVLASGASSAGHPMVLPPSAVIERVRWCFIARPPTPLILSLASLDGASEEAKVLLTWSPQIAHVLLFNEFLAKVLLTWSPQIAHVLLFNEFLVGAMEPDILALMTLIRSTKANHALPSVASASPEEMYFVECRFFYVFGKWSRSSTPLQQQQQQQQDQAPAGLDELDCVCSGDREASSNSDSDSSIKLIGLQQADGTGADAARGGDEGVPLDHLSPPFAAESAAAVASLGLGGVNMAPLTAATAEMPLPVPLSVPMPMMELASPGTASRSSAPAAAPWSTLFPSSTASMPVCSSSRSASQGGVLDCIDGGKNASGKEARVSFLTKDGPNLDNLVPEGESEEGGFAEVRFFKTKHTGESVALKTCKDTAAGKRQILVEIDFLRFVASSSSAHENYNNIGNDNDSGARHIVAVRELLAESATPMILMRKEPQTLRSIVGDSANVVPAQLVKVLTGVPAAVGWMISAGYLQRDIKPENILVSESGEGILADFGLVVRVEDAGLAVNIGAGTEDYSAKEVFTTGSVLPSELFSVATSFVEMMIGRCPFNGEELMKVSIEQRVDMAAEREILLEDVQDWREELARLEQDIEGPNLEEEEAYRVDIAKASARLEEVRTKEWYLGVRSDGWQPGPAAVRNLREMSKMDLPLDFLLEASESEGNMRTMKERENAAAEEAKCNPSRLFWGDWLEWLPASTRAPCDKGLLEAITFVVNAGMLDPTPEARPQTVEAARGLLQEALRIYELCEAEEVEEQSREGAWCGEERAGVEHD
eukprot:g11721.t1